MDPDENNDRLLEDLNNQKIAEYAPAIAYSGLVIVIGIAGNIFSMAYYGFKAQKTTTNFLITALATTDFVSCIVFCDEIIELCFTITFKNVIGCKIMYFTSHTLVFSSGFILFLICLDRFQKICRRQSWQMTMKSAKMGVCVVVIFCLSISVRYFIVSDVVRVNLTGLNENKTVTGYFCTHSRDSYLKPVVTVFQLLDFVIFMILIPTMLVLYSLVAREIWRQRKKWEKHMNLQITKSNASASDSNQRERSTDLLATGMISSGISVVHRLADTKLQIKGNQSAFGTLSDNVFSGKNKCAITKGKDIDVFHFSNGSRNKYINAEEGRHQLRKLHAESVEKKIAIMMIVTTAGSVLSFVPYFVVNLAVKGNSTTPEQDFSVGMQIALRSFMLNNAINPYIMGFFNRKFKQFVKSIICTWRR